MDRASDDKAVRSKDNTDVLRLTGIKPNTNMRKVGAYDTVTRDITGHATREMFDRYNMVDEIEKTGTVKKMEEFLFGQMNEKGAEEK